MIPFLQPCLDGTLAYWRTLYHLRAGDLPAGALAGSALLDADPVRALVTRFSAQHPGGDPRAIVSMWTQWYFGALIVPATAALLVLDRVLPVGLDEVSLAFDHEGKIEAVLIDHGGTVCPPGDRFASLIDGHLAPVIRHLTATFAVSPRLLWANAAATLDWTLDQIEPNAAGEAARRDAHRRLSLSADAGSADPGSVDPLCRRSPMAGMIRRVPGEGGEVRQRRTCCLRYLLPGIECCGDLCPLPEAKTASLTTTAARKAG